MNKNYLEKSFEIYLRQAEETDFSGWNFSFLGRTGRMYEAPLEWNYYNLIFPELYNAETLLDMGTGGGEFLSILSPLPPKTVATELYGPNVPIARKNLEPLGVEVVYVEECGPSGYEKMPFENEYFDLVINRGESYFPPELKRILKRGSLFITQQVGSENLISLVEFLTGQEYSTREWNLKVAVEELASAGLSILKCQENLVHYRFYDVGAIAYLFKAVPWTINGYSINQYKDKLWQLHVQISEEGYYDSQCHRFMITCNS